MDKCPVCGAEVHESHKRCKKCGTPINTKKLNFTSSKVILGIIIAVLIIAIVAAFASGIFTGNDTAAPANDDSPAKTVEPITGEESQNNDSQSDESVATEYWASAKTDKFHLPDCEWAEKIGEDNKIVYSSREEAIADGYVPCKNCRP